MNAGLADQKIAAKLVELGGYVLSGTPADFGRQLADEIDKRKKGYRVRGHQAGVNGTREYRWISMTRRLRRGNCAS